MKDYIFEKVKSIAIIGIYHVGETHRFNDDIFSTRENIYEYRISRIKVFIGENNSIRGLQAFYKNKKGEVVPGTEGRDINIKELDIKILDIPPNDYLCNLRIFVGDDYISKLIFTTRTGKELIVGNDDGEEISIYSLNSNKDNIILNIAGGYRDHLDLFTSKYINIYDYLVATTIGYFELKKKLRKEDFKQKILKNFNNLSESNKALFHACCLTNDVFKEIFKYLNYI